jgi:hypothetical protein
VHLADRGDDVLEQLHGATRDRGDLQSVDPRRAARVDEVGTRADALPCSREDDVAHLVVGRDPLERLAQGDHDVERHGVHPLRPVEGDQRDVRPGLLDADEAHTRLDRPSVPT